jgi:thioredoxin-related protein
MPLSGTKLKVAVLLETETKFDNAELVKSKEMKKTGGKTYIMGSRAGCCYLNSFGKKVYVNRELCN